jgi:hypothetical protein
LWDVGRVGKEGAKKSDRAELQSETEPVVVSPAAEHETFVLIIEVEEAGELFA